MKYMKGSVLLALLLLLGFGGVAEAQECVAGAKSANVRAEGETEKVGVITVRCRGPKQRDQDDPLTLGTSPSEARDRCHVEHGHHQRP